MVRKLVRPSLKDVLEEGTQAKAETPKKTVPAEQAITPRKMTEKFSANNPPPFATHYEIDYLISLIEEKKHVTVTLTSGEEYQGFIEYYDKKFIRLTQENAPNQFIFKTSIKYIQVDEK